MIEIARLFSTPVFATFVSGGIPGVEAIKNYEYETAGGSNSQNAFITRNTSVLDDFPDGKQVILNKFNDIKDEYLHHKNTQFAITRSWGTRVEKNCITHYHRHSNNYFSGVFYFEGCTGDSAPIEFESPLNILSSFELDEGNSNEFNLKAYSINLEKNTLIFFPSYLSHRIGRHLSDTPRHSLAFNLHPIGKYGRKDSELNLTGLE
jgi:hypothetical protein